MTRSCDCPPRCDTYTWLAHVDKNGNHPRYGWLCGCGLRCAKPTYTTRDAAKRAGEEHRDGVTCE